MQVFKGRDAQQLERLAAAPSSWRVFNLHHSTRMLQSAGGSTQRRFFQTHQLNHALFTKHTLREHERAMFVVAPAVATKVLIPLDRGSFSHGAISLFIGERGYEVAMRQWLGLKVSPAFADLAPVGSDAHILTRLAEMPAFDPFLMSETFGGGLMGVSPDYLRVSLLEDGETKAYILRELAPLIRMATGSDTPAKVHKFVDSIFGHDIGTSAADFLKSMGLPESSWAQVVSAWKAALRYEVEFVHTRQRFMLFLRQLSDMNAYGYSERVSRHEVDATISRMRDFARRVFGNIVNAAQGFNSARRAQIIADGRIGDLRTYLQELPEIISSYAGARAVGQHTLSYWEYRTRGLDHTWMPAEPFCHLANDLMGMEIQYTSSSYGGQQADDTAEMRRAFAAL